MDNQIVESFEKLKRYCEKEGFKGYDPYDGLNSRLFQSVPLVRNNRLARLAWIQAFKRSPVNLRRLTGVKKEINPKALGIFLSAYCRFYENKQDPEDLFKIHFFTKAILENVSKGYSGACWGYNFDWEARAFFQPKHTPTIVASSFIANALLDAYEITGEDHLLKAARSTCDFILQDLNRSTDADGDFAFSYSRLDTSIVFNATLLGSRLLARVFKYTGEEELFTAARSSVAFCCKHQQQDGSWSYGTYSFHQWIDNFHTGYNLECLQDYKEFTGDKQFSEYQEKGFQYYINTFFTSEGISKYYSNSTYPIDIHAPAQLIITLVKLNKFNEYKEVADRVINWTINHMQDKEGYFYFQVNRFFSSRIPYMRWSQAWMLYSLALYINVNRQIKIKPVSF
jgi:rhamnogalacturonyl hydrolase YesR